MADIFISYAKEDRARVAPLAKALADHGWSIWWDRTIPAGKTWREVIGEALESARSVVVVWSKASVKSRWVQEEADWGLERKMLIPILLDEIRPPLGFGAVQAVDLVHWDPAQSSPDFEKLISDISIILGPSPKQAKEAEKAAEQERKRKEAEEEEHAREAEAERKAQEERKRKQEEERRKAEERRRFEDEQKRAEAERKAEEERKRKEVEEKRKAEEERKRREAEEQERAAKAKAERQTGEERKRKEIEEKRQAEEERKHKEAEVEAERARKAQVERKAETPKPERKEPRPAETRIEEAKLSEPESSKPKPDIKKPGEKSPATKIGILIALAVVIGGGAILYFKQEPTRSRSEISEPQAKSAEPPVAAKPSESSPLKKITNSIGMEFVLIPAGSFKMGSNAGEADEKPPHEVQISQSFYFQATEVTQGQWKKVMKEDNPSSFNQCGDDCPVESVFWDDAKRFIEKLNQLEKTKAYRLPSEAEWEYACRAGTTTEYLFGDDAARLGDYAWYFGNSNSRTQRVAGRKPNSWGLYDMHGNVWEWVEDDWHGSYERAPSDGRAWVDNPRGSDRVMRGGSWLSVARHCRSAVRLSLAPVYRSILVGFRLSRSVALGP